MGLFDKVSGFVKREAEDIGEMADRARDRLDEELKEREAELEMTPAEKLRALQRKGRETDDRIDQIMEKAGVDTAEADAVAEVQATAPRADLEPPSVTQIVLPDGSVRSGDDLRKAEEVPEEDQVPDQGDLAWIAPRDGEEAIVPAFSSAVQPAAPSGPNASAPAEEATAPEDTAADGPSPGDTAASPEAPQAQPAVGPPPAPAPTEDNHAADTVTASAPEVTGEAPPPPPPPPMAIAEPEVAATPAAAPVAEDPPKRETPAEIAARVVAELEQAVAEDPEPTPVPAPQAPAPKPEPAFDKTPAQRKYEEARRAADALLEELRGELRDDGEI